MSWPPRDDGGPETSTIRRNRFWPRSLTARLVTGVVVLVAFVVASFSGVTYYRQRSFLSDRLNSQLIGISDGNVHAVASCLGLDGCRLNFGGGGDVQSPNTEWLAVLNGNGKVLASFQDSDNLREMKLTQAEARKIVSRPNAVQSAVTTDGYDLRLIAKQAGNSNIYVLTGLSTDDLQRNLSNLISIELLVGLGAVLVASLATAGGVRFTLRRLRGVTLTAQEVAAELSPEGTGLDRRVPDDEHETEVGQLAASFNTMLAAVEAQFAARVESEQRMRQFLADASHELRTPLTSIRGYAELARMQRAAGDTSEDNIGRIESEGTRMSRLVEDLLMLARGDADGTSRMRRELVDVDVVVDDAVAGSRAAFPERTITDDVFDTPQVIGDPDQLLRVVRNLITNAAVHTAADRPIAVRAWNDPAGVVVQVVDGGPGLPPAEAAHVFERFWRADKARTRARGGSGLGLSIVATIVRAHGGSVRFDSSVEAGSTVTVTLPPAETPEGAD